MKFPTLRLAIDTGGTFTDLVVEGDDHGLRFFKSETTPHDPTQGIMNVLKLAANELDASVQQFLKQVDLLILGTTRATNAIVTNATARTAFLTTKGHPDILLLREGGGRTAFDYTLEYPDPYIPRSLTFEVPERILADGTVYRGLDEETVVEIAHELRDISVEAVAVCFLWSIVNPAHEIRVGELLDAYLPGVPYTLSHRLNPSIREYRRASSAAIDASLKPLMGHFLRKLANRLGEAGFDGRLLIMTSAGGVLDAQSVAAAPIHSIGSGPAAAPIAGRYFAQLEADSSTALVTDAGGTTYDVSLVNKGRIPWTREATAGNPPHGFITGFPSVDVRSIGAGGGSIARVDSSGLLAVGPESAGAEPGPACYGHGGNRPTVTDACVVLGYLDPDNFLGGQVRLSADLARRAVETHVAEPLGLPLHIAASAVLEIAIERMVGAIEGITLKQGIDPSQVVMIGGGGGAGLYSAAIARRLHCQRVIIPTAAPALSAVGALLSELRSDAAVVGRTTTTCFDYDLARDRIGKLRAISEAFIAGPGRGAIQSAIHYSVEARYPHQVWEIEVPLSSNSLSTPEQLERFRQDFHNVHDDLLGVRDVDSPIEIVMWHAQARCRLRNTNLDVRQVAHKSKGSIRNRLAFFPKTGLAEVLVVDFDALATTNRISGPAIIEMPAMSIVVDPEATAVKKSKNSLTIYP